MTAMKQDTLAHCQEILTQAVEKKPKTIKLTLAHPFHLETLSQTKPQPASTPKKVPEQNPRTDTTLQEKFFQEWEEKLCYEGTLIYGGTGSGKTSGAGRDLALRLLRKGFGGLVLAAKNDEAENWKHLCQEAGREKDIILFSHETDAAFNFIAFSKQTTLGIDLVSNCALTIQQYLKNYNGDGHGRNEAFWQAQQDKMIENFIRLLYYANKKITVPSILALLQACNLARDLDYDEDRPGKKRWENNILCKLLVIIKSNHPEKFELLDGYIQELVSLNPTTYGCITAMVTGALHPLTSELLEAKLTNNTTATPDDILFKNKIVIIGFDIKRFQAQGKAVNLIWKEALQTQSEATAGDPHRNSAFLWMDEGQNFMTNTDHSFLTTARSARVATVFLTQNIHNIPNPAYKSIFQTVIFHQNPCPATNAYMEDLVLPPPSRRQKRTRWSIRTPQNEPWGNNPKKETHDERIETREELEVPTWEESHSLRRMAYDLRTGGHPTFQVDALLFHKGKTLNPTGERFLKIGFQQLRILKTETEIPPPPTIWLISPEKSTGSADFKNAPLKTGDAAPKITELRFRSTNEKNEIEPQALASLLQNLVPQPEDIVAFVKGKGTKAQLAPFTAPGTIAWIKEMQAHGTTILTGLEHDGPPLAIEEIANFAEITSSAAGARATGLSQKCWEIRADKYKKPHKTNYDDGDNLLENNPEPPKEPESTKEVEKERVAVGTDKPASEPANPQPAEKQEEQTPKKKSAEENPPANPVPILENNIPEENKKTERIEDDRYDIVLRIRFPFFKRHSTLPPTANPKPETTPKNP